jgi:hypothetical protein
VVVAHWVYRSLGAGVDAPGRAVPSSSGGPRERLLLTGLLPHSDHEARRLLLLRYVSLKMLPRHQERFKCVPARYQEDNQEDNHPTLSHCEQWCMFAPLPASCLGPPQRSHGSTVIGISRINL